MNQQMNFAQTSRTVFLAILMSVIFVIGSHITAQAATVTVTKTADTNDGICNSDCSLREAIATALSGDEIYFDATLFAVPQTIQLLDAANSTLLINKNLTINGTGANFLTVRGATATAIFRFSVFTITPGLTVHLKGLKITGGAPDITNNGGGAGILTNGSSATISDCFITDNFSFGSGGGGIRNTGGTLIVNRSTISGNSIDSGGGGGIDSDGTLFITDSTVSGNSKLGGNSGTGGISVTGTAIIRNSTITNNQTSGGGGTTGGIQNNGSVTIRNTIVAGNVNVPDVGGANFISEGYNLIGATTGSFGFSQIGDQTGSVATPINPRLDGLANYGGTTLTHRLQLTPVISPALDKGKSFGATADQRGGFRPIDNLTVGNAAGGDGADIGAFEADAFVTVTKTADTNDGVCNADCSLREAIAAAPSGNTIIFSALFDTPQTITLSDAAGFRELSILDKSLSIQGKGAQQLTIRRDSAAVANFRIFNINSNASGFNVIVNLSGMTVTGGRSFSKGGGIRFDGDTNRLTIANCHITGNSVLILANGGGISSTGVVTILSSTVSNNTTAGDGGGIYTFSSGDFVMTDSTVSGNTASNGAGGIVTGRAIITSSTITDNGGTGAGGIAGDTITIVRNTIIAGNRNNSTVPDVSGEITSQDFNLIGNVGATTTFDKSSDQKGTAAAPLNPLLALLAPNGGTTPTHALLIGSPAIDAGFSFARTADQRGSARPIDNPGAPFVPNGDNTDIGAFESTRFAPIVVTKTADTNDGVCDADCSLREAIAASVRGREIIFSALFDTPQTITLSDAAGFQELLILDKSLSITGKGANLLTIRRDLASALPFRIFRVRSSAANIRVGLNLSGVTVTGGRFPAAGGGIRLDGDENRLTLTNCHITGNVSVSGNGGGIYSAGLLTLIGSTVSNNTSGDRGGGIYSFSNAGDFVMTNSTVSGNVSSSLGGGIFTSRAVITNSTVTDNLGGSNAMSPNENAGGISGDANTIVRNTIAAANRNNSTLPDVSRFVSSQGYNIIGNVGSATGFNNLGDQTGTAAAPLNPLLDALGNYGGTTLTHQLRTNSPAIDKGSRFGSIIDQRGLLRPFDNPGVPPASGGDNSDIGAFEVQISSDTFVVTKTADTNDGVCDADCSLREAIAAAVSGDEIEFASPLFNTPRTITLSGGTGFGQLIINKNLIINGNGAHQLTIRRDSASPAFRIFNIGGAATVTLQGMTITGGRDGGGGGGVLSNSASTLTINNCHITDNFANQFGGGIRNLNGTLEINNSTVSNNSASIGGGGGIDSSGTMEINNSTVSGNRHLNGDNSAGGIVASGAMTISNTTITDNAATGANSAGGIYQNGGTVTIRNSIVAGNRNNATKPDVFGAFTSSGFNLVGNRGSASGFNQTGDQTGTSAAVINPQLAALALSVNAITPTHELLSNSPAIDKGKSFGSTVDQRGQPRPVDRVNVPAATGGDNADIGAFEAAILPALAPQVSAAPNPATTDENQAVVITLTATDENTDIPLTLTLTDQTDNGTLSGFNSSPACSVIQNSSSCSQSVTYTPNQNFLGSDSFSFKASDGQLESSILTVNITVQIPANVRRVTKTADTNDGVCDADCSLREAIATAAPGNTIEFNALFNSPQTITLSGDAGFGQLLIDKNLMINGKGANLLTVRRDAAASSNFCIFNINGTVTVTLQGMTITGGSVSGGGGGILNGNTSTLTVNNSHITGNYAAVSGAGIRNLNGNLIVNNSTISNNQTLLGGGGIHISGGSLTMTNSTVSGNSQNSGDNVGGILANGGTTTITNSTITNNQSFGANGVSGIYQQGAATVTLRNTIIAANRENAAKPDVAGAFISNGYNIIGNRGAATGFGANDQTGTSAAILNPQISVLGNFGGRTPTHALFSNSTAVNAADPSNPLATDQRGIVRTIGGRTDIGAFENNFTFSSNPTGAGGNGTLPDGSTSAFYTVAVSVTRINNLFENIIKTEQADAANLGSPFEFTLIAGSLPAGLMLNINSGILSGMPTESGTFNFTIKATDPNGGSSGAQAYVLNVFGPTAATVTIGGRVFTTDGRGLRNARVTLTNQQGNSRTVLTSSFGYFNFADVAAGETVIVSIDSKRFSFQTQIINVIEDIADLNFTAIGTAAKSEETFPLKTESK